MKQLLMKVHNNAVKIIMKKLMSCTLGAYQAYINKDKKYSALSFKTFKL